MNVHYLSFLSCCQPYGLHHCVCTVGASHPLFSYSGDSELSIRREAKLLSAQLGCWAVTKYKLLSLQTQKMGENYHNVVAREQWIELWKSIEVNLHYECLKI